MRMACSRPRCSPCSGSASRRRVARLPAGAVIREGDIAPVWVETEPMLFKRRVVDIGTQQDGLTQIRKGLGAGESVVARGAIFVDNEWRQCAGVAGPSMLRSLIAFCLSRRLLVMVAFAAFLGLGFVAFLTLNIEAYPDPAPPIIEIIAQQQGQSPEEVERYVTIPIEIAVASTPGLKFVRSNTVYALGFLRLQFEYGRDYYFVRQQTINRLKDVTLPTGVAPVISPAGGISEIMRYQLKGPPDLDVMALKTLQDWVVERRLRIVPGVADIAGA